MFLKEFFHWSYQFVNRFQNKKIEKIFLKMTQLLSFI